jgi:signal transduction histidine kinase
MGRMSARGVRPSILFDQAAAPLGQDASGRYYRVRLADDPMAVRVLKRFDHPGWRSPTARLHLSQQLWRLIRLDRPELPGLTLEVDTAGASSSDASTPHACVVAAPGLRSVADRMPLDLQDATAVLVPLLETLSAAHQARVAGLRFDPACVFAAETDGAGWRWMAPDLVPPEASFETSCREDLQALARLGRQLIKRPEDLPTSTETPYARALAILTAAEPTAVAALQQVLAGFGQELTRPRLPSASPLMGCESELETLGAWLRKCAAERQLHVLWLSGDPGSLQWDLCDALATQVRPSGMRVIVSRARAEHSPEEFLEGMVQELEALRGENYDPSARAEGLFCDPPAELPPGLARLRSLQAFRTLLLEISQRVPVCLAWLGFEDSDGFVRDLVDYLRAHGEGLPVMLLLGYETPTDGVALIGPGPEDEALHLRPLFRAEVERLARAHCPGMTLGLAALDAAWAFSGGLPSSVYRLCLHWLRSGGLRQDAAGAWVPRDAGPHLVPAETVREFLRAFASIGSETTLLTMWALMDMPESGFFELLEAALDSGWLRQEPGLLAFWRPDEGHEVARQIPPAEALRWHRRLAAVGELPAATRAFHASQGGQDVLAGPLALVAGRRLLSRGMLEAASAQFSLGRTLANDDPSLALDLLEGLVMCRLEALEPAQALALLAGEFAQPTNAADDAMARLASLQARARLLLGDRPGARSAYERALPALAPSSLAERTRVTVALAELAYDRGERERGLALATAALVLASRGGQDVLRAEAHVSAGRGALMGPRIAWPEGFSALEDAIALGTPVGQLEAVAQAHRLTAQAHFTLEMLAKARTSNEALRGVLSVLGRSDEAEAALLWAAWIALLLGDFDAALAELASQDFELTEAQRPDRWVQVTTIRAVASLHLGHLHDPLRLLDQALRTARNLKDEGLELAVLRQLVASLLFLGKIERAEEICQSGLGLAAALGDRGAELALRTDLAELTWRQGDLERGGRLYQRVRDEAADMGLSASHARALAGLARLAYERADYAEAHTLALEALQLANSAGHPLLCAEVEVLQGNIALALDERKVATSFFEAARIRSNRLASPHFKALALFGLGQSVSDPALASGFLSQATDQMNIYLEQLSVNGRKDFLSLAERRQIVDLRTTSASSNERSKNVSLPGTRSALFELLKQGQGSSWGAWQDSLALLDEIFGLVTSRLPLEELLTRMNETFMRISQATRGLVFLANEDGELKLRDTQMVNESSVLGLHSPVMEVLDRIRAGSATIWIPNALEDPSLAESSEVRTHGLRGVLCIPLKVRRADGTGERVLGCLYGDRQATWVGVGDKEVGLLELMARYISVTLEIGVLQDESSRKTHRLEMLNDLSRALAGTLDLERLLTLALTQIMRVSAGQQGYLFFGDDLKCRASLDQDGRVLTEIQVSRSVIDRVARDRRPLTILDVGADEDLVQKASLMIRNVRSVMCVPLLLDDRLVGLIYVSSASANKTFTRNDLDLMTAIAAQIALALQNAQAYEIIKELNLSLEAKVKVRTNELEGAYRELQETQAQLLETEKLATIGTLAGGVAHEINNPLGAVLTNAQLLMDELTDPDQIDSLRMIEEGARRCKEIVSALLKYSRPPQASHRPVDLRAVIVETLGLFEHQLQQDGIRLATTLDAEPTIMGDATELRQVLTHLLLNAFDAIRELGRAGQGCISLILVRELDGVKLVITDNGAGMAPDVLKRIFDPFYTTKKVGSGTGLGLSVCQRVIDKHGGKLLVTSTPNEGSVFTILLPAA